MFRIHYFRNLIELQSGNFFSSAIIYSKVSLRNIFQNFDVFQFNIIIHVILVFSQSIQRKQHSLSFLVIPVLFHLIDNYPHPIALLIIIHNIMIDVKS